MAGKLVLAWGLSSPQLSAPENCLGVLIAWRLASSWVAMIEESKWKLERFLLPSLSCHSIHHFPRQPMGPPDQPWFNVGGGPLSMQSTGQGLLGLSWKAGCHIRLNLGFCLIADGRCWKRKQEYVSFLSTRTVTRSER